MTINWSLIGLKEGFLKETSKLLRISRTLIRAFRMTYHVRPHEPIIDQQDLGLRGLVHKEAIRLFLTFTNVCLKAFMLGAPTALWSSAFHLLITLFEKKIPRNIPCAPNLFKFTRVTSCTFALCIYLKQFLQCDRAISMIHFKNLYNILSILMLF